MAYTACPKKSGTVDFQYLTGQIFFFFTSLDKISSAEENDTKIIKFGWVILNLCTFVEIQSFSNFAGFLGPMSKDFCRGQQSIRRPVETHCSVFLLLPRINGLPQNTVWKVCCATIFRSPVAKIQRNLKMTVFHEMVIESKSLNQILWPRYHSLLRKTLSNDVKIYNTFSLQWTENLPFRYSILFCWATRCRHHSPITLAPRLPFPRLRGIFPGPATTQNVYQGIEWFSQLAGIQWLAFLSMLIRGITITWTGV